MKNENIILDRSFEFALTTIDLFIKLQCEKEFIISKQLLRCGTSIGANVNESTAAESRQDFIHKLAISSKEARETKYWLRLLSRSNLVPMDYSKYLKEVDEIIRILTAIVKTSQQNTKNTRTIKR